MQYSRKIRVRSLESLPNNVQCIRGINTGLMRDECVQIQK